MIIASNMNLDLLAEHIGPDATREEAREMRDLLVEQFDGQDTADVLDDAWTEMVKAVGA